jgi:hypothetical protein
MAAVLTLTGVNLHVITALRVIYLHEPNYTVTVHTPVQNCPGLSAPPHPSPLCSSEKKWRSGLVHHKWVEFATWARHLPESVQLSWWVASSAYKAGASCLYNVGHLNQMCWWQGASLAVLVVAGLYTVARYRS